MPRFLVAVALGLSSLAAAGQAQPGLPRQPGRPNFPQKPSPPLVIPPFPASPPIYLPPPIVIPPFVPPLLPPLDPPMAVPAGTTPGMSFGPVTNEGTCTGCNKAVHWSGNTTPKKCPHCGVRFTHIENEDGSSTRIPGGGDSGFHFHSFRGVGKLIALGVVVVVALVGGVAKAASGGGPSRPKRRKAKKRRPVEDDDEEPTPRRARPRADDAIPMATLADDPGYEVVGDAPAVPEPPRRAKAKLIPPDGGPR